MPFHESPAGARRRGAHLAALCFVLAMAAPLLLAVRQPSAAATPPLPPAVVAARHVPQAPPLRPATARAEAALQTDVSRAAREVAVLDEREQARAPEPGGAPAAPERQPLAAVSDDLALVMPAAADADAVVGFHQAGSSSGAAVLDPAADDHEVMASRGRGTHATTAVDVALPVGSDVLSPVDGVVTTAAPYRLYGRTRDLTVVLEPDDDPASRVHLFHLEAVDLVEGDRVVAGQTRIGRVRVLPFGSQIDRLTGDERPHVHLEVRPGD